MSKKILLFSYNPVPTSQYKTIEGSALRFWRMALGLKAQGLNDITIAVWQKFPQKVKQNQGIKIINFDNDPESLKSLAADFQVVVFSCAMGDLSLDILRSTDRSQQVIIDAYSPMYVEFLTKSLDSKGDQDWLNAYKSYADAFNQCLPAADYALIANDNQRHLYRGVLGATSQLATYDDARFINLPAFVESSNGVQRKQVNDTEKLNLLWFGGVYPWFDISDLIYAFSDARLKSLATLTIVGGSNPFYPKDNVRFNGKFIQAVKLADKLRLTNSTIFFKDWVEYYDRIEVFNSADAAISINSISIENDYSFRLRVADLAGNGVPIITNGGDPLGEFLIARKAAFKFEASNKKELTTELVRILNNRSSIDSAKKILSKDLYKELHIDGHIHKLADVINNDDRPRLAYLDSQAESTPGPDNITAPQVSLDNLSTKTLVAFTSKRILKSVKHRVGIAVD